MGLKKVPEAERARLGLNYLYKEQLFLLQQPDVIKKMPSLFSVYDPAKNYPIFAPNKLVYENLCEPCVMEPECTVDRVRLVEESVFCIKIFQADNLQRDDDPASINKTHVHGCEISTENFDGWIEIPIWLAFERLLRFQPR